MSATPRPLRLIYVPTGRALWFDLARLLAEAGVADPVLWLGDGVHDAQAKTAFPSAEVVSFNEINFRRQVPRTRYNGQYSTFWTSPALHEARDHAIKLMDRSERFGPKTGPDREAYFIELCLWAMDRIANSGAEVLLMAENPHSAPTYVLYAIARFAGLEILAFASWPLAPIVTLRRGLMPPDIDLSRLALPSDAQRAALLARFRPVVEDYVARFNNPQAYAFLPRYMQIQAGRDPLASKSQRTKAPTKSWQRTTKARKALAVIKRGGLFYALRRWAYGAIKRPELLRAFRRMAETAVPTDRPYVYFPLHYEPERTTNPDGGAFHDQLRALARLRALVPPEVDIYAKEHPSQFNARMYGHLGRTERFYRAVRAVSGVHLLAETVSSAELMLGAKAVAAITGTAALEAALLGRPALVFGGAWFEGCPNVTRFTEALDWESFSTGDLVDSTVIRDWLCHQLSTCGLPACVNPSNAKYFAAHYADGIQAPLEAPILAEAVAAALATAKTAV